MKLKRLSYLAAVMAAAVLAAFPVQASSLNAVPQTIQAESSVTAQTSVTYFGSEVQEAYTYNPAKHTYHKITDAKQLSLLIKLLESGKTKAPKASSEGGFLLVTAGGKHEIYFDSQEKELLTLCKNNNAASPGLVQWLVFMSADKITEAEFTDDNYTETDMGKSFRTDERWALTELSNILKTVRVKSGVRSKENPRTGGRWPGVHIAFHTGVDYNIKFYDGEEMEMWSSDMDYHIVYQLQNGETDRVFKAMREIGRKNPTYILPVEVLKSKIVSITMSGSWGDSHFHIDTSTPWRIEEIIKVLKTMRVYGVGIFTDDSGRNPMTSAYNGFEATITYQDGSTQRFEDYDGELWIYTRDKSNPKHNDPNFIESAMFGYTFTEKDHKKLYDALYKAV